MTASGTRHPTLGYCTNVHAGIEVDEVLANLETCAVDVRRRLQQSTLPVGLWLTHEAARTLRDDDALQTFADRIAALDLAVFTINGFPWGAFHGAVVKDDVYLPNWTDARRVEYTLDLARILARLTPAGGSISTVPIGWPAHLDSDEALPEAARRLEEVAAALARQADETGVVIHVDLEPEPGCVLDDADDVAAFFGRYLLQGRHAERNRTHLRVCHDVCHAAVMFRSQRAEFERYRSAGVRVGKVQVSSALATSITAADARAARVRQAELGRFDEPRYLHQTVVRQADQACTLYNDLADALADGAEGEWRVHFHVPVDRGEVGVLGTTQADVLEVFDLLAGHEEVVDLEVETYAWDVLPADHRGMTLAASIAAELAWCRDRLAERRP